MRGGATFRGNAPPRRAAGLFSLIPLLSACSGPLSVLDPAGPAAGSIAALWWAMFWGGAAIFALVMALLGLALFKPGFGRSVAGRHWILWGGLAMPAVVLTLLVAFALFQGERLLARPLAEPPLRVEAHARQWVWEFAYPQADGIFANADVLHIPAGRPVDVLVTSADVIHSFWVPRLGGKIDAIPGHETILRLTANRPGIYRGVCSEFCGEGHAQMRFAVEAHAEEDYAQALRALATAVEGGSQ